jgi:hypothetical protein
VCKTGAPPQRQEKQKQSKENTARKENFIVRKNRLLLDVPVCLSREMWGISQKNQLPR